nr:DegT/DnrJ/EryC1/StrS family aminotransferase [Candidatus Erwinia dacicola]
MVVHYVKMGSCDMNVVMMLSQKYNISVIEDAVQAIDFYYKEKPLGSIGAFRIFPFHETKNIISGKVGC